MVPYRGQTVDPHPLRFACADAAGIGALQTNVREQPMFANEIATVAELPPAGRVDRRQASYARACFLQRAGAYTGP